MCEAVFFCRCRSIAVRVPYVVLESMTHLVFTKCRSKCTTDFHSVQNFCGFRSGMDGPACTPLRSAVQNEKRLRLESKRRRREEALKRMTPGAREVYAGSGRMW